MQHIVVALSALALALVADANPPFSGTVFINTEVINASDPSSVSSVTYVGQTERQFYDSSADKRVDLNVYLFDVRFDVRNVEFELHPEYGSREAAREQVNVYAEALGRLPRVLRSGAKQVEISIAPEQITFAATNANDAGIFHVYSQYGSKIAREGWLEEIFIHEGTHISLDRKYRSAPGWLAAQEADGAFISDYARDYTDFEDLAETFLVWFAARYHPERLSAAELKAILDTVPNRLAYLDEQNLDMSPYVKRTPVPALPFLDWLIERLSAMR